MSETKTRPILFNTEMVRAILDNRKTQTRRVIKPQPISQGMKSYGEAWEWKKGAGGFSGATLNQLTASYGLLYHCPYGISGDRLWVRETWKPTNSKISEKTYIHYRADCIGYKFELNPDARVEIKHNLTGSPADRWKPSIHMPRWASRITLEITDVRAGRLFEITVGDLIQEGIIKLEDAHIETYPLDLIVNRSEHYTIWRKTWNSINAKRGYPFDSNPWVWVVEFEVLNV